jgi:hypothetical protein
MRDPLYHQERAPKGLDDRAVAAILRMQRLKLASGAIALVLIAAIWIVWRWG